MRRGALILIVGQEDRNPVIEIDVGNPVFAVAFSPNGKHLVSSDDKGIQVWRVEDGTRVATMKARSVRCLAVSKDGQWIAARTNWGKLFVWNAETHERVFSYQDYFDVNGVDFSPDATRLVVASQNWTASVWDIATCKQVQTLRHTSQVIAAKYSHQGDRIATATYNGSVRVYDSNDGRLLVDIPAKVTPWHNTGLLWFNDHLFVVCDSNIRQFNASTGSLVSEWPVADGNSSSCIALPKYGEFIAHSTKRTVSFWNTSTHVQLTPIDHPQDIHSIALSPDDRFLAIGGEQGKITIHRLSYIIVSFMSCSIMAFIVLFLSSLQQPDIRIDDAALESWKQDQLLNAEALLTSAISESRNQSHHALANRALVRARLGQWDAAIIDATEVSVAISLYMLILTLLLPQSTKIQPSVTGYIAKSVALVGNGEKYKAYRACDIAFGHLRSTHVSYLLLIKVCTVYTIWPISATHTP